MEHKAPALFHISPYQVQALQYSAMYKVESLFHTYPFPDSGLPSLSHFLLHQTEWQASYRGEQGIFLLYPDSYDDAEVNMYRVPAHLAYDESVHP